MKRIISIVLLLLVFAVFYFLVNYKTSEFTVLDVISPTEIVVDLNNDKIKNKDEIVIISDVYAFTTVSDKNKDAINYLKLSKEDSLRLGYLSENFTRNLLKNKKIKIVNKNIFINNINYKDLIINKGFAVLRGSKPNENFYKNLKTAKTLDLFILNKKNNKYHKLNCKYGQQAKNQEIMEKSNLPKDAVPCKYCIKNAVKRDNSVKIKQPKLFFGDKNLKLILSDMTVNLKPRNDCSDKICKTLVNEIDSAKRTIDFAIYGYTKNPVIENSLKNALQRGVKVRFVFDSNPQKTNIYSDTFYLATILKDNNHDTTGAVMHNKFFIFDNKRVLTGSANLSSSDMSGVNSNAVLLIDSPEIASVYEQEFEQMFSGKFHDQKIIINKNNNSDLSIYFSPADKIITTHIIPLINSSKKYIYIPAFLITHEKFAQSLINAKKRGVKVKIILDSTNTKTPSKLQILRNSNIPVKTENYAGKLHSKSIIIDDKYLVIGSMNFSLSGENKNDENVIILENPELAKEYRIFFEYLWKKIPDKWLKMTARAESPDSEGSCFDGIDNDFDGNIDLKDEGCKVKK